MTKPLTSQLPWLQRALPRLGANANIDSTTGSFRGYSDDPLPLPSNALAGRPSGLGQSFITAVLVAARSKILGFGNKIAPPGVSQHGASLAVVLFYCSGLAPDTL